jgi:hypothetical protein
MISLLPVLATIPAIFARRSLSATRDRDPFGAHSIGGAPGTGSSLASLWQAMVLAATLLAVATLSTTGEHERPMPFVAAAHITPEMMHARSTLCAAHAARPTYCVQVELFAFWPARAPAAPRLVRRSTRARTTPRARPSPVPPQCARRSDRIFLRRSGIPLDEHLPLEFSTAYIDQINCLPGPAYTVRASRGASAAPTEPQRKRIPCSRTRRCACAPLPHAAPPAHHSSARQPNSLTARPSQCAASLL